MFYYLDLSQVVLQEGSTDLLHENEQQQSMILEQILTWNIEIVKSIAKIFEIFYVYKIYYAYDLTYLKILCNVKINHKCVL